ncbi:D-2-hydroxyacid dehydrogenase family protein [Arenibaculum pallidiluteum]|uniref:D-2-hydroxyacid dehydrogenase family protein n=1 Tax=Arenibaculum pallidiluteum TaxID=2812559 RepID=UPI001A95F729|nr:D-2-hydroxyacid dehydrogenase family protein [Arenibaculum pallidiluteum]
MLNCAILDDYQKVALTMADWQPLRAQVGIEVLDSHFADREALARRLEGFEILVAMRERTPFDAWLLDRLPRLKLLVTTGMRNAAIDMAAARVRGVTVCGTEGSGASAAEMTWGLLLALARRIPREAAGFRDGRWQSTLGIDLRGRRLGIVGLGNLGRRVARYGLAFEMRVTGWSRSLTEEASRAMGIEHAASLDELLQGSDVVTIHLPLTAETRGLVGARELGLMKPGALLVNTARGPIVDEAALISALEARRIGGAALDVFDVEPLPSRHALRELDNVVATPHLGYVTEDTYRVFFTQAVEDIAAWLAGAPLRVLNG